MVAGGFTLNVISFSQLAWSEQRADLSKTMEEKRDSTFCLPSSPLLCLLIPVSLLLCQPCRGVVTVGTQSEGSWRAVVVLLMCLQFEFCTLGVLFHSLAFYFFTQASNR